MLQKNSSQSNERNSTVKLDSLFQGNSFLNKSKIRVKIKFKQFPQHQLQLAINQLVKLIKDFKHQVYGIQFNLYQKAKDNKVINLGIHLIMINNEQTEEIILIHLKQKSIFQEFFVNIQNLSNHLLPIPQQLPQNKLDSLLYCQLDKKEYIGVFESHFMRDLVHQALQYILIQQTYQLQFSNELAFISNQLNNILDSNRNDKQFSPHEVLEILKALDFNISLEYVKILFYSDNQNRIYLSDIKKNIPQLLKKSEIGEIFDKYCFKSKLVTDQTIGCMTLNEFRNFLSTEQGMQFSENEFQEFISKLFEENNKSYNLLSYQLFAKYLFNEENTILNPEILYQNCDMSKPMNQYFISTSRQTLQFDQSHKKYACMKQHRKEPISSIPILFAIEKGARYFEITVWDGSQQEPICFYGPMMNYQVPLKEIMQIFKNHSFKYSSYPVIIQIDDHTSSQQRTILQQIIQEILGGTLVYLSNEQLKSPEELQGKILISKPLILKYKSLLAILFISTEDFAELAIQEIEENDYQIQKNINVKKVLKESSHTTKLKEDLDTQKNNSQDEYKAPDLTSQKYNSYEKLQFYSNNVKEYFYFYELISNSTNPLFDDKHFIIQVTDWTKCQNGEDKFKQVIEQNRKGKIYKFQPACKSTDNQNSYCSQGFLSQSSLIMIHPHLIDYNYMYFYAQFSQQNALKTGYLIKTEPHFLISYSKLMLQVISGTQLNNPQDEAQEVNPFVQILLRTPIEGLEDQVQQKVTKLILDNSFNPIFNSFFEFEINDFETSALMFCVYNQTPQNLILWNCAMLRTLRTGYRIVNLLDEFGNKATNSKLFCKLWFE